MFKNLEKIKQPVIASILLILLTSLFISRALLSVTTICFFITTMFLYAKDIKPTILAAKKEYLLFPCIFFLSVLTGLQSEDTGEWANRVLVKLPFMIFPLAFMLLRLEKTVVFLIENLFILLVTGGTVYTMSLYYLDTVQLTENYLYAAVLPTIIDNDHIRFSWCVVIALLLLYKQLLQINNTRLKIYNGILAIWLFIFLHILMSKTGLLMLYCTIGILLFYLFFKTKKKMILGFLFLILLAPFISYYLFPTFQKRVDYIKYDFSHYSKGIYKEGLSDGARIWSIKAGLAIVTANPLIGVGYGDVKKETNSFYENNYQLKDYEKILPSSQYLIFAAASGITGLVLFLFILFYPFHKKSNTGNIFFVLFYIPALLSLLFEIPFESQFGVFIFCFFTLWFLKFGGTLKTD